MSGLASTANALVPWAFIIAFCTLIVKVRLSGDPALWRRVEALEAKLEKQAADFQKKLDDERADCARKISALEGRIRQLQQQHTSLGHLEDDRPLAGPLTTAFPVQESDQDNDLISKLDKPSKRRRK